MTAFARKEYYHHKFNVVLDLHPVDNCWDWMIEQDSIDGIDNGPVYWHRTVEEPSIEDVRNYLKAQDYYD